LLRRSESWSVRLVARNGCIGHYGTLRSDWRSEMRRRDRRRRLFASRGSSTERKSLEVGKRVELRTSESEGSVQTVVGAVIVRVGGDVGVRC